MALITTSIGTAGRNYSTMTLWEAALGGAAGGAGNDALGEAYDDSVFDESVIISDATPDSITLSAAAGERHDGTAGTGARIVRTAHSDIIDIVASSVEKTVSWLEVDANGNRATGVKQNANNSGTFTISNNIVHGTANVSTNVALYLVRVRNNPKIINNILYDIHSDATVGQMHALEATPLNATAVISNNTIHDVTRPVVTAVDLFGLTTSDTTGITVQNNIVTDVTGDVTGTIGCYELSPPSNATYDHNLSSDATASGTGSLTNKASADQFVSTVGGSEDLHLKAGADAIDVGTELGNTPAGVAFDIDGVDRRILASTDMGAHDFIAAAPAGNPWYHYANQAALAG